MLAAILSEASERCDNGADRQIKRMAWEAPAVKQIINHQTLPPAAVSVGKRGRRIFPRVGSTSLPGGRKHRDSSPA